LPTDLGVLRHQPRYRPAGPLSAVPPTPCGLSIVGSADPAGWTFVPYGTDG